jgi:hypothetical protein
MIFYEDRHANYLLQNGFTSFMNGSDLNILAKYFKYIGKNKSQIRESLIEFCEKYNPDFNYILARNKIEYAIKICEKYGLRFYMDIIVTESEMEKIRGCGDYKHQKILFAMLAVSKYFKYNDTKLNKDNKKDIEYDNNKENESQYSNNFYVNEKFINIVKSAKVNVNKVQRKDLLNDLQQGGFIETLRRRDGKIFYVINIVDENSPKLVVINDMYNVVDFCPFYCEVCGEKCEKSKRHNYCEECYQEKRLSDMRIINKNSYKRRKI